MNNIFILFLVFKFFHVNILLQKKKKKKKDVKMNKNLEIWVKVAEINWVYFFILKKNVKSCTKKTLTATLKNKSFKYWKIYILHTY